MTLGIRMRLWVRVMRSKGLQLIEGSESPSCGKLVSYTVGLELVPPVGLAPPKQFSGVDDEHCGGRVLSHLTNATA